MKYLLFIIIALLLVFWFIKIKIKIESKQGYLIITNIFKIKISLNKIFKSQPKNIKEIILIFKNITNPLVFKILSNVTIDKINITLGIKEESNPFIIFTFHMLLIEIRNICYKYFKNVKNEKFVIELQDLSIKEEIIMSINLGKLVMLILMNFNSFKKIIKYS